MYKIEREYVTQTKSAISSVYNELKAVYEDEAVTNGDEACDDVEMPAKNDMIIESAKRISENMIKKTREKCEQIIEEAEKNKVNIEKEAYDAGYSAGLAKAQEDCSEKLIKAEEKSGVMIAEAELIRKNIIQNSENEVIELVFDIVKKILKTELKDNDHIYNSLIVDSLEKIANSNAVTLYINPADLERIFIDGEIVTDKGTVSLDIRTASDIDEGNFIIETQGGTIEMNADKQIQKLRNNFSD